MALSRRIVAGLAPQAHQMSVHVQNQVVQGLGLNLSSRVGIHQLRFGFGLKVEVIAEVNLVPRMWRELSTVGEKNMPP